MLVPSAVCLLCVVAAGRSVLFMSTSCSRRTPGRVLARKKYRTPWIRTCTSRSPQSSTDALLSTFVSKPQHSPTFGEGLRAETMMGLLPLWVFLTWMVFPVLALAAESASASGVEGMARLRPWPTAESNSSSASCNGESFCWNRPPGRGGSSRASSGRILFVSVGFYGHAMPLLHLAEEMAARGHNVTFGTHNSLRSIVDETPGVAFLSTGRMPMREHQLRGKLRSLSQAGGFWGLLTLLNDVYLPLARPMYRALLAAVMPPIPLTPLSQAPRPPPPPRDGEVEAEAPPAGEGGQANGKRSEGGVSGDFDPDPGDEGGVSGDRCLEEAAAGAKICGVGGGVDFSGKEPWAGSDEAGGSFPARSAGRHGGGEEQSGSGVSLGEEAVMVGTAKAGNSSTWTRPFDLVVLDMGSLGGLDFAQKLGIPYMFNSPSLLFDLSGRHATATLPAWGTGMARRMRLGDRLQNAISPRALSVFLTPAFISMNKARREQGLEAFHAQDDVFHGARILVNTAFGFEYPHDLASLLEMTGPLLPPRVARALSSPVPRHSPLPTPETPPASAPQAQPVAARATRFVIGGGGGKKQPARDAEQQQQQQQQRRASGPDQRRRRGDEDGGSGGSGDGDGGGDDDDDPLALPFLIRTWLAGTGALVAPGTAAFEAVAKQAASAKQRAESSAWSATEKDKDNAASVAIAAAIEGPSLPDDNGVIYVNLGRMPQLDKWQMVTVLQALSSPSEAMCWGGGGSEDRLGRYRVLWVLPREQREHLLSALLPMAPPPSFRLKVVGGLPHFGILAHSAVKAVVSHCGMGAAQEALIFGKPLLCLPMLADQEDVARRVADAGAGLGLSGLPTGNISSGDIRDAMADVVSDPSFRSSAEVLSGILRRAGGTLRAADVVEGTLRLGGSSHLHPPEFRGRWHQTSSTDAYALLVSSVILTAILGYALLAAVCYGMLLLLRATVRATLRSIRWVLSLPRHTARLWRSRENTGELAAAMNGTNGARNRNNGKNAHSEESKATAAAAAAAAASAAASTAATAAAAAAAVTVAGGGLWDEALMTLLGGPGPPDPFPEDSLHELDGPAIDRRSAPGAGGRHGGGTGGNGGRIESNGRAGGNGSGSGGGGGNGHLRSLSGELVMWPTAPNDGRAFDFRGWSSGGSSHANGNDVSPHHMKRWD